MVTEKGLITVWAICLSFTNIRYALYGIYMTSNMGICVTPDKTLILRFPENYNGKKNNKVTMNQVPARKYLK